MTKQFVLESLVDALRQEINGYDSFPEKHQLSMAQLIWVAESKRRAHTGLNDYASFGYQELRKNFGKNGFVEMNDQLGIFEITSNWSAENGETRGYKLTERVRVIKHKYLVPCEHHRTKVLYSDSGGKIKILKSLPGSIEGKESNSPSRATAKAWRGAKILNKTPVSIGALMSLHKHIGALLTESGNLNSCGGAGMAKVGAWIESIGKLIKLAQTDVAGNGYTMIRYAECSTGRLYARGTSLQTMPRIVRDTALQGLFDYDIENCNFAIFEQMAARYGYQAEAVKYYLENKQATRSGIAERIGITEDQAKKCLLAILQGAKQTSATYSSIPREIGADKAKQLYTDAQFQAIAKDALNGCDAILKGWPRSKGTLVNDLGKAVSSKEKPEVLIAHLLQGVEAKAIKAAVGLYPYEIVLLMHDGFVSIREIDTAMVEREMYEKTGYKFTLSGGKIMPNQYPIFPK